MQYATSRTPPSGERVTVGAPGRRLNISGPTYRALLIGVWDYPGADSQFVRLYGPERDPVELKRVLTTGPGHLFEADNVRVVDPQPDHDELAVEIDRFLKSATPNDTVLLYYSGHGALDPGRNDNLYLCATDVTQNNLSTHGLDSQKVSTWLRDCRAQQKIVILDCCYAGGFKGGPGVGEETSLLEKGEGRFVMAAADLEKAHDGKTVSPFTELVIAGLEQHPDEPLSIASLAVWVEDQTTNGARRLPLPKHSSEGSGDIVIRKVRERPAPLTGPALPVLTLRFEERSVVASFTGQPERTIGPLNLSGAGSTQVNLLSELYRLSAVEAVCQDQDARPILDAALVNARILAGQVLFDELFDQDLLAQYLTSLQDGSSDPRLEVQLDLSSDTANFTRMGWEYLSHVEPGAAFGPGRQIGRPIGDKVAVLSRGVSSSWSGPGWKGGDGAIGTLVHSQFNEDHPVVAAIRTELELVARSPSGRREMLAADVQPRGEWARLTRGLADPEINVVVLIGELKEFNEVPVLQVGRQQAVPAYDVPRLVTARGLLPPPELIVIEALPVPGIAEKAFALTALFARSVTEQFGCPVVAVSHSRTYVASVPALISAVDPGTALDGTDIDVTTVSAHLVNGLRCGVPIERSAYELRQKISQDMLPMPAPIVYMPIRAGSANSTSEGAS
jgi:hypothetical protein